MLFGCLLLLLLLLLLSFYHLCGEIKILKYTQGCSISCVFDQWQVLSFSYGSQPAPPNDVAPVALLITVIGRVIIQRRRLTDWFPNELTRRGPVRELESSGRWRRRIGAVAGACCRRRPHTTRALRPVIGRDLLQCVAVVEAFSLVVIRWRLWCHGQIVCRPD